MTDPVGTPGVAAPDRGQAEAAEFVRRLFEATPHTWVTTTMLALNLGVFGVMVATGVSLMEPDTQDLLRFGADFGPLTASGQWWRLLSSTFVHIGLVHVGVNMWALWQGGRLAERFFGNGAFLFLYLASGIGASVASLLWHPTIVSAGASGSIFGVFGSLLAVVVLHRHAIPPVLFRDLSKSTIAVVAYNVLFGATVPGIDNAAHLGGLATGFALGLCLRRPVPAPAAEIEWGRKPDPGADSARRYFRALPVAALVVAGAAAAKLRVDASPEVRSRHHFDLALEAFEAKDPDRAMKEIAASLALRPDDPLTLGLSGDIRWSKGDPNGAAVDYVNAARIAPDWPYPRKRLAGVRQDAGDLEGAIRYFADVIRLEPTDAEARSGRGWIRLQQGKPADALADLDAALELDPRSEIARTLRPYALYDLQRWPEALAGFRRLIEERPSRDRLPELYVWAIRARTGEAKAADEELKSAFANPVEAEGRSRIADFLLGRIAEAEFIAAAEEQGAKASNGQSIELCESWYFVGMKHLVEGKRDLALRPFRECVATKAIDTPACSSAAAELAASDR